MDQAAATTKEHAAEETAVEEKSVARRSVKELESAERQAADPFPQLTPEERRTRRMGILVGAVLLIVLVAVLGGTLGAKYHRDRSAASHTSSST